MDETIRTNETPKMFPGQKVFGQLDIEDKWASD